MNPIAWLFGRRVRIYLRITIRLPDRDDKFVRVLYFRTKKEGLTADEVYAVIGTPPELVANVLDSKHEVFHTETSMTAFCRASMTAFCRSGRGAYRHSYDLCLTGPRNEKAPVKAIDSIGVYISTEL